jgi:hypothetical protein
MMDAGRPRPAIPRPLVAAGGRSDRDQGSAYLIALMATFLLVIMGLSLTLFTQTEILSGGQERQIERTFYTAEAGIDLSISRALANADFSATEHIRNRSDLEQGKLVPVSERVVSSPLFCLGDSPCNLCSINQGRVYIRRNHVLSVNADRFPSGSEATTLGRKSLTTMVDMEPTERLVGCIAELPDASGSFVFDDFGATASTSSPTGDQP